MATLQEFSQMSADLRAGATGPGRDLMLSAADLLDSLAAKNATKPAPPPPPESAVHGKVNTTESLKKGQ